MIGRPDLLDDERFKDDLSRGDHGEALSAYMSAWCADRTTHECLALMDANKVPGGPVLSPQELLELPHVRQVGILQDVEYPTAATPPQLAEHTDEILGELGYDAAAVARLRGAGVV